MAHQDTEGVEKVLWEKVKSMPIEDVREEVEGWFADPGSTASKASAHNRLVMLYWVMMNLVTHSTINIEAKMEEVAAKKEGDMEPVKAWKEHNEECQAINKKIDTLSSDFHLMHRKVDQISTRLGIALYHPEMEQQMVGGSNRHAGGRSNDNTGVAPPSCEKFLA